jgi:hypothetical protein
VRFSHDLSEGFFDQLVGERRVVRYVRNRAVVEFRPRKAGQRVEVLDGTVYAWAVRHTLRINFKERAARSSAPRPAHTMQDRAKWIADHIAG